VKQQSGFCIRLSRFDSKQFKSNIFAVSEIYFQTSSLIERRLSGNLPNGKCKEDFVFGENSATERFRCNRSQPNVLRFRWKLRNRTWSLWTFAESERRTSRTQRISPPQSLTRSATPPLRLLVAKLAGIETCAQRTWEWQHAPTPSLPGRI